VPVGESTAYSGNGQPTGSATAPPANAGVAPARAGDTLVISKAEYTDKMFAMWLAECIANWTGLTTENARPSGSNLYDTAAPFFTDADWGAKGVGRQSADIDWVVQDVWGSDDDTDIEYSYLHEMAVESETAKLSPEQIAHMWNTYVSGYVWFSDSAADLLLQHGVLPPSTTLSSSNQHRNIIDSQLTVELFGALTPGRPDIALDIAQLPIRTTAGGFATHAGQFEVIAFALAPLVDQRLSGLDQMKWLITETRKYLPPDSRISEIIDWVMNEYNAHPTDPWETLREKIFQRYQKNSVANGFNYITKPEAAINLGNQVAELLYSQGDLTRAIQIGTLFGWDSDNPTASNAALIGLMKGSNYVAREMAEVGYPQLSELYNAYRTRVNLPDYLPANAQANDTFTLMAERALPLIEETTLAAGGTVSATKFSIPVIAAPTSQAYEALAAVNPDVDIYVTSANNQVRRAGGSVTATSNLVGDATLFTQDTSYIPSGRAAPASAAGASLSTVVDGDVGDTRGLEEWSRLPFFVGSSGTATPVVTVAYDRAVTAESIRLVGGDTDATGGWITGATLEVRGTDGAWKAVTFTPSTPIKASTPFQQVDLKLPATQAITAFRVTLTPETDHVTLTELDAIAPTRLTATGYRAAGASPTTPSTGSTPTGSAPTSSAPAGGAPSDAGSANPAPAGDATASLPQVVASARALATKVTAGQKAKIVVAVAAVGGVTPTSVTVKVAGKTVTAPVSGGTAVVTLPKLKAGTHTVTVVAGDQVFSAGKLTVTKVKPKVTAKRKGAKLAVTVKATGATPTGKVTVKVAGKTVTGKLKAKAKGKVSIKLPSGLKAGTTYTATVTYKGNTTVAKKAVKVKFAR
jgi:hypothetical protein